MNNSNENLCDCSLPEAWVSDPSIPIEFDEELNEYHLTTDGHYHIMRYCFWCGGRFPDSKRGDFFTPPDEIEQAEIRTLLADTKTAADVLRILGSPDETYNWEELMSQSHIHEKTVQWKKTFRYSTRWKTLILDVQEMPDGKIGYSMGGRHIGDQDD